MFENMMVGFQFVQSFGPALNCHNSLSIMAVAFSGRLTSEASWPSVGHHPDEDDVAEVSVSKKPAGNVEKVEDGRGQKKGNKAMKVMKIGKVPVEKVVTKVEASSSYGCSKCRFKGCSKCSSLSHH
jgi:hypothetical protein